MILKDLDSIGIREQSDPVRAARAQVQGEGLPAGFGNEKQEANSSFKWPVHEISREKLRCVKKATIL